MESSVDPVPVYPDWIVTYEDPFQYSMFMDVKGRVDLWNTTLVMVWATLQVYSIDPLPFTQPH